MLPIARILEYQAEIAEILRDANGKKLFNYIDMIIDKQELANVLKDRVPEESSYLISVMPDYTVNGDEDSAKWENILQFFILDKTDYSEHDRDSFRNIFISTQAKAQAFVEKLIEDKANVEGLFCGFLSWLKEDSIIVRPVMYLNDCNGWTIEINLETNL